MINTDRAGALLILCFSLGYALLIQEITLLDGAPTGLTARSMPTFIAGLAILISLWLLLQPGTRQASRPFAALNWLLGAPFCLLMSLYGFGLRPLGYLLSTFLFLAGGFFLLGERRGWLLATVALSVTGVFWLLLSAVLGVYLPLLPPGLAP